MEKTDKVVNVQPTGTFESQYGADIGGGKKGFFCFEIAFANGDVGQYSAKIKEQIKFKPGEMATYEYTPGEHPKVKPVQQGGNQGGGGGKKFDPVFEKKKQIMIVLQSQMERAMEFHEMNGYECHDNEPSPDNLRAAKMNETCETMEYFAERILRNKYIKAVT